MTKKSSSKIQIPFLSNVLNVGSEIPKSWKKAKGKGLKKYIDFLNNQRIKGQEEMRKII